MTDRITSDIRDSYESIPYLSGPHYAGHPDCMATVARLRGLPAAPVARCRVLDLGCATGGHLLPMALSLPDSEFVGVDLAPGHVATAAAVSERIGLTNTRFVAADLRELPDDLGTFDYVVCHGVYSWVPEDVRRALLRVVGEHLTPDGIAMISFNALPGSQARDSVRALLRFALGRVLEEGDPVEQTGALLEIVRGATAELDGGFVEQLRTISKECSDAEPYYLAHEYLAPVNRAFHLWEVARDAETAGLTWVGDAWDHADIEDLPTGARTLVERLGPTSVDRHQWLDFFRDTAFRRALFRPTGRRPSDEMDPAVIPDLHASGGSWPVDAEGRRAEGGAESTASFASRTHRLSTNVPIVEVALRRLHDLWPRPIPVRTLWEQARDECAAAGADSEAPADLAYLSGALLQCYRHHLVTLHSHPFAVSTEPPDRPIASALARLQANGGDTVTNLVHQRVRLDEFERSILRGLDGSRGVEELVDALSPGQIDSVDVSSGRVRRGLEVLARAGLIHEV